MGFLTLVPSASKGLGMICSLCLFALRRWSEHWGKQALETDFHPFGQHPAPPRPAGCASCSWWLRGMAWAHTLIEGMGHGLQHPGRGPNPNSILVGKCFNQEMRGEHFQLESPASGSCAHSYECCTAALGDHSALMIPKHHCLGDVPSYRLQRLATDLCRNAMLGTEQHTSNTEQLTGH